MSEQSYEKRSSRNLMRSLPRELVEHRNHDKRGQRSIECKALLDSRQNFLQKNLA